LRSVDKREKGLFVEVIYMSEADVIRIEYDIYSYNFRKLGISKKKVF